MTDRRIPTVDVDTFLFPSVMMDALREEFSSVSPEDVQAAILAFVQEHPVTTPEQVQALVDASLAALVDGAPGTIDTLNELAAALGNDPNFATTIVGLLAGKASAADLDNVFGIATGAQNGLAGKADTAHSHAMSAVTGLIAALQGKMPYPAGGGSNGYYLVKTNSVVGAGSTYEWKAPPARGPHLFVGGINTTTGLPHTTDGYVYGDTFLSTSPGAHLGKLFFLFEDLDEGNYWSFTLQLQTI